MAHLIATRENIDSAKSEGDLERTSILLGTLTNRWDSKRVISVLKNALIKSMISEEIATAKAKPIVPAGLILGGVHAHSFKDKASKRALAKVNEIISEAEAKAKESLATGAAQKDAPLVIIMTLENALVTRGYDLAEAISALNADSAAGAARQDVPLARIPHLKKLYLKEEMTSDLELIISAGLREILVKAREIGSAEVGSALGVKATTAEEASARISFLEVNLALNIASEEIAVAESKFVSTKDSAFKAALVKAREIGSAAALAALKSGATPQEVAIAASLALKRALAKMPMASDFNTALVKAQNMGSAAAKVVLSYKLPEPEEMALAAEAALAAEIAEGMIAAAELELTSTKASAFKAALVKAKEIGSVAAGSALAAGATKENADLVKIFILEEAVERISTVNADLKEMRHDLAEMNSALEAASAADPAPEEMILGLEAALALEIALARLKAASAEGATPEEVALAKAPTLKAALVKAKEISAAAKELAIEAGFTLEEANLAKIPALKAALAKKYYYSASIASAEAILAAGAAPKGVEASIGSVESTTQEDIEMPIVASSLESLAPQEKEDTDDTDDPLNAEPLNNEEEAGHHYTEEF